MAFYTPFLLFPLPFQRRSLEIVVKIKKGTDTQSALTAHQQAKEEIEQNRRIKYY